ncbi:uncharacterized protein LOC8277984 [Ricinus communis]|uniref:DUF1068 domain-containing protein n=1 Tax=Ricinus communis TaxID=3988 RepID=B9RXG7_RICCO|nr:uncharacterized protein LOC8277984 [Ricinus communis]EEF43823.1 conserved hypothetical protein [Ricinus communis]|eukprot:XP_002518436.1 uncharacterized protein LOC8277984 [Ricinus communis]
MKGRGKQKGLKVILWLMGICTVGYILGPPLHWHLSDTLAVTLSSSSYCATCHCDCSSLPLLSLPRGLNNNSFTDCMKNDPEVSEEMEKSFKGLLSEEVGLKEAEALRDQQRADVALLEAKKMASQYQKDADKCNAGMGTCEEARESAESTLEAHLRLSAMWELRARQRGWKESMARSLLLK